MKKCVAVIGAGKMGSVVAGQLPRESLKVIIDHNMDKAKELAYKVDGKYDTSLQGAKDADAIFVILPANVVEETVEKLQDIVKTGTVIVNMATSVCVERIGKKHRSDIDMIDAKIIGNASTINREKKGIVVVKTADTAKLNIIQELLSGLFIVEQGDADIVEKINTIAVYEGIKAAVAIRKQLMEMDIPEKWSDAVLETVCMPTMKSYIDGTLGPFAKEIAKKLEND